MKVASFITAIIAAIVASVLTVITHTLTTAIQTDGIAGALSAITFIPLLIIFFIVTAGSVITGIIASIKAIGSEARTIKIISIILLLGLKTIIVLNITWGIQIFNHV